MRTALPLLCLMMISCATTIPISERPPVQKTFTFNADFDAVWGATVAEITERQFPIQAIEKDSGVLSTEFITAVSGFMTETELKAIAYKPRVLL